MPLPPNNAGYQVPLNVTLNPASLNNSAKQVQRALGRITGQASEFQKSLDASTARVFAFGATTAVLTGVTTAFKTLVSTTIEVEKKLIDLKSILGGSTAEFNQFREVIFDVAKTTGQTFAITADAAGELARQGLSATETAKRLKDALILTNTSGLDSVKSVNALTAAINGFTSAGLTSTQIVNKLTAVDRAFAVSAKDLAEAFQRTGSSAEDAGVSFDELLGLITSVQQRTSRGGAVIGNALKSIFTRVSRGETIEKLQALGVAIDANQSGVEKLKALSDALQSVSDPTTANAIKELAGGVYQINIVSAALKDLGDANSIFTGATLKSAQATNEAYAANDELQKSISAQINGLIQGVSNLAEKIGQLTFAPLLKDLISLSTGLAEGISKALDPEKGNVLIKAFFNTIGAFLSGPAVLLFSVAFAKIFKLVAGFAKEGFKTVLGIGGQAEKIKSISEGINKVLAHNVGLQQQMVSSSLTEAQKRGLILQAIQSENQALLTQQKILNDIAKAAFSAGVRGFQGEVFVGKKGQPIAAAGFIPNFSMGEMLERQGAREHGYKAGRVKQTRIYDGNGKSFNSFVNSREKITTFTNAIGKKATIVQPPNGFGKDTQFAASGFVPNFAEDSFGYISALRNLAKLSPTQLAQKLTAPRSSPDERLAAKFLIEQKQGGNFDSRAFIRDLDAKRASGRATSSVPAIVGGINLNKPNVAEGMAATFVAKGINSPEELEKYRVAGTKSFNIDGKTLYESEANNLLGRTRKANVTAAGEKKKREIERGYENYNINADALGGILLVSPRFGLNGPRASASLNAYDVPSLYGAKGADGSNLFDKTQDKNAQRAKISIKGIQTTGVPQQGKDVLGISKDINELMAGPIVGLASRMYGDLFNIGDRQEFSNKLAGFKSSASGGLLSAAAEGSIFEAASKVALSSMKEMPAVFDPAGDQRPFDFSNAGAMKRIFGVNSQRGEAKRLGTTGYQGQIDGIVKKVFNDPEYSQKALSTFLSQRQNRQAQKSTTNAASGFIPNFSAVQDAIAREKSFGLSDSQIYVDKNSALRSSQNPLGLGVFNTRDEPNGPLQGINRAKSEGKNPKSYGAAGGFVPNFAPLRDSFLGKTLKIPKLQIDELQKDLKDIKLGFKGVGEVLSKFEPIVKKAKGNLTSLQTLVNAAVNPQAANVQRARFSGKQLPFLPPSQPRASLAPNGNALLARRRSGPFSYGGTGIGQLKQFNQNRSSRFQAGRESLSKEGGAFDKLEKATFKLQGGLLSASFAVNSLLGDFPNVQNGLNVLITSLSTLSLLAPAFPTIISGFTSLVGAAGAATLALAAIPVAIGAIGAYFTRSKFEEAGNIQDQARQDIESSTRQGAKNTTFSRTAKEAGITDLKQFTREINASTDKGGNIEKLRQELFAAYDANDEQKVEEARKKLLEAFIDGAKAIDPYNVAVQKLRESSLSLANSFITSTAKINSNVDKFLFKLEKQSIAESIASNISVRSDSPFESGVKNLLKIRSERTNASQAGVSFFKAFADTGGIAELIKSRVTNDQVFAASGGQASVNQRISSGQFQQESFLSYIKDGTEGLKSKIEEAVGPLQNNEAGQKFFETIKNAAQDFRDRTIEGYQAAKNIQSQLENDLVSNRIEFVKAIQTAITNLPSSISDISNGPKVDPLSLFKKFEEASKLLNSGKQGDAIKGSSILGSTSEQAEQFKKLFGEKSLLDLQTKAGLSGPDISKARGAASIAQIDFSKIEESIRKNLSGNDLVKSIKALQDAQADPSKIKGLIDTISQTFSPQRLQKEGGQITKSLAGVSKASFEDEGLKGLNEKQVKLSQELDAVSTQVLAFGQAFAATTIPDSVNKLDLAVRKASENISDFSTFTAQLSDLSKNIGPRLSAIEAKLNQLGN